MLVCSERCVEVHGGGGEKVHALGQGWSGKTGLGQKRILGRCGRACRVTAGEGTGRRWSGGHQNNLKSKERNVDYSFLCS